MFFRKKKAKESQREIPVIQSPCQRGDHRYRDFNWYIKTVDVSDYYSSSYIVRVIEPYVCIHCGHREDIILGEWKFRKKSDRDEMVKGLPLKYRNIRSVLEIEDAINDMQLVDREYLSIMQQLHPDREYGITNDQAGDTV